MNQNVDRAFKTFSSKYSSCTIRVWLYKGENSSKYLLRFF
jgi:hypothetical protein